MDCVCGCGVEVPKSRNITNISAYLLAAEIAEWDKARTFLAVMRGMPLQEADDQFMADGMYCYESLLAVLHGQATRSDTRA